MKNLSPSVCHSDDCKEEESLAKCYGLAVQCHSERLCLEESPTKRAFCMRSLTFVRDDIEIPCRPAGLARNDKRLPPSPLWLVMSKRKNARLYRAAESEGEDGNRARTGLSEVSSAAPGDKQSGRQEYPITSGRPFLVTSLRRERSYNTLSF